MGWGGETWIGRGLGMKTRPRALIRYASLIWVGVVVGQGLIWKKGQTWGTELRTGIAVDRIMLEGAWQRASLNRM